MMTQPRRPLLTAEWRHLAMLNYEIDPQVLTPLVPAGVELDLWQGRALVSMVGFMFSATRVWGRRIPCHETFEEVNLRFYVRRETTDGVRRGVVFIREIVPRWAIAYMARRLYNEPYIARKMSHTIVPRTAHGEELAGVEVEYAWRSNRQWNRLWIDVPGDPQPLTPGSEAEFITEHYWGYTRQRDGSTLEYQVTHPAWRVWGASACGLEVDAALHYGPAFTAVLEAQPVSAFLAEGSEIAVFRGERLGGDGAPAADATQV